MPGAVVVVAKLTARPFHQGAVATDRSHQRGWRFIPIAGRPALEYVQRPRRPLSTLLAGMAGVWRDLIRERTSEGRKRATAEGVKFGWTGSYRNTRVLRPSHRAPGCRRDLGHELSGHATGRKSCWCGLIAKSYSVAISMLSRPMKPIWPGLVSCQTRAVAPLDRNGSLRRSLSPRTRQV
jgi:hypothetical protein